MRLAPHRPAPTHPGTRAGIRRRAALVAVAAATGVITAAGPVLACAGLVTPSGNVKLVRTATLAAWHDGFEHYVTAFTFTGGGAEVGSIVPLPGVPSNVERGGDWTLQRLDREAQRKRPRAVAASAPKSAAAAESDEAEVIHETRIDALDITILRGGGGAVADWARENGFSLTPDAPEVLDFYATRSPVFMAARFDATAADEAGQQNGEGTPVHLTIPLDQPWVPLRILGLGRPAEEFIDADVFLLTPERPALLPEPTGTEFRRPQGVGRGMFLGSNAPASASLLADLRSDKGMEWVPEQMWFTSIEVFEQVANLKFDLAMDVTRARSPSPVAAGLASPEAPATTTTVAPAPQATVAPSPPTTAAPTPTTAKAKASPPPAPVVLTPPPLVAQPAVDGFTVPGVVSAEEAARRFRALQSVPEEAALAPARPLGSMSPGGGGRGAGPWTIAAAIAGGGLGAGLVAAALRRRRAS